MRFRIIAPWLAFVLATGPAMAAGDYLNDLLKEPAYLASWNRLFADRMAPAWVTDFESTSDGVVTPSEDVTIGGEAYVHASLCKPHDCAGNTLSVLFSANGEQAWALLTESSATQVFGNPDDAIVAALKAKAGK